MASPVVNQGRQSFVYLVLGQDGIPIGESIFAHTRYFHVLQFVLSEDAARSNVAVHPCGTSFCESLDKELWDVHLSYKIGHAADIS